MTMPAADIASHLDALSLVVGAKNLLGPRDDKAAYEQGARHDAGRAAFVVRPANTSEVSRAVSYCVRHGIRLIPQSGNSGLVSGSTPDVSGTEAVLSLDRLNSRFCLDRANRSLQIDAGFRLSEINSRLSSDGLFFPIDLGADPRIGGMLATNTGGARFLRHGDVRANTLGLMVVLPDEHGTVLDLSNSLRKNNTGVDWKQLFIGTSGAFGIITGAELNVARLPRQVATAFIVPNDPERIAELLIDVEACLGDELSAFEGMSGAAVRAALAHVPSLGNPFAGGRVPVYLVLIEVSRTTLLREGEADLDGLLQSTLGALMEHKPDLLADVLFGSPQKMWALRHALSEGVRAMGQLVAFDLSFRRGDVMAFRQRMAAELAKRFPGVVPCDFGHVADGGLHFNLVIPAPIASTADPAMERDLREAVLAIATGEFGGSFSAEHAIGRKNQAAYDRFTPPAIRALAANFKNIAAPGPLGSVCF